MTQATQRTFFSKPLTNVAIEYTPPDLVATRILPRFPVEQDVGMYNKFDKKLFDVRDDARAPGDEANEIQRGWIQEPYQTHGHALVEKIPVEVKKAADPMWRDRMDATEYVKQLVWNQYELAVLGTGGILRTAANNIYANDENWSNLATADVRASFNLAIEAIEVASGVSPNTVVMTPRVARHIMSTAQYREEFKYVVDIRNEGAAGDLPSEFYGLKAIYARSLFNSARRGSATSLSRIMGDDVWIGYVNPSGVGYKNLTYGATFEFFEEAASWYEDRRKSWMVQYDWNYTPVVVAKECGALLQSVLS
jgi:hypothetical protein